MNIQSEKFRRSVVAGAEKTATGIWEALHSNPGLVAGAAVAKAHLMGAYGHKIPVIGRGFRALGQGAVHAGIQHGVRGEKPLGHLARASMAVFDPSLKHAYESGLAAGQQLRSLSPNMGSAEALRHGRDILNHPALKGVLPEAAAGALADSRVNRAARALTTHVSPGRGLATGLKRFLKEE